MKIKNIIKEFNRLEKDVLGLIDEKIKMTKKKKKFKKVVEFTNSYEDQFGFTDIIISTMLFLGLVNLFFNIFFGILGIIGSIVFFIINHFVNRKIYFEEVE